MASDSERDAVLLLKKPWHKYFVLVYTNSIRTHILVDHHDLSDACCCPVNNSSVRDSFFCTSHRSEPSRILRTLSPSSECRSRGNCRTMDDLCKQTTTNSQQPRPLTIGSIIYTRVLRTKQELMDLPTIRRGVGSCSCLFPTGSSISDQREGFQLWLLLVIQNRDQN
jgi:hypothetical protein